MCTECKPVEPDQVEDASQPDDNGIVGLVARGLLQALNLVPGEATSTGSGDDIEITVNLDGGSGGGS